MKMVRLEKGCCTCKLRTTGLTVAMLGIVASTLLLMYMVFALGNIEKFCKQVFFGSIKKTKEVCDECQLTSAHIRAILMFIGGVFSLSVHIALEVGISKNKPVLVMLYIVIDITSAIILSILGIVLAAMGHLPLVPFLIALVGVNLINVYLVLILYSLKCKLETGKIDRV